MDNWKQKLAEYFGYKLFEDMDTSDQMTAEKAVEFALEEFIKKFINERRNT